LDCLPGQVKTERKWGDSTSCHSYTEPDE